jgi:hypothetical protein
MLLGIYEMIMEYCWNDSENMYSENPAPVPKNESQSHHCQAGSTRKENKKGIWALSIIYKHI